MNHLNKKQLESGLDHIRKSPKNKSAVDLIVRRPETEKREILDQGELDIIEGLLGDNWSIRGSRHTADGSADPDMQLNIMNSRVIVLVAQDPDRWHSPGDPDPKTQSSRFSPPSSICCGRLQYLNCGVHSLAFFPAIASNGQIEQYKSPGPKTQEFLRNIAAPRRSYTTAPGILSSPSITVCSLM